MDDHESHREAVSFSQFTHRGTAPPHRKTIMEAFSIGFGHNDQQHGDHADGVRNLPGGKGAIRFGIPEQDHRPIAAPSSAGVEVLAGGTLRISHGTSASQAAPATGPQSRVYSGTTRFVVGQEAEATTSGVSRYAVSDAGRVGGSIMATLRREGGASTVETVPGNPASRTMVEVALREGLIRRDERGHLSDFTADEPRTLETIQAEQQATQVAQQRATAQAQAEADQGVFSAEEDQAYVEAMAPVPDEAYRPAVSKGIAALALDQGFDGVVRQLAESGRMELDAAERAVEAGRAYFQNIADRAVMQAGIPEAQLPAFYESLRGNPNLLMSALNAMTAARDVGVLRKAAREWASNNAERLVSGGA